MRLLRKLLFKLLKIVIILGLFGAVMRYARPYIMKAAGFSDGAPGIEGTQFASEESDLMATVFKSALRFLSGSASRDELAGELSDKLYEGRAGADTMSELGIELVKPGDDASAPGDLTKALANSTAPSGKSSGTKLPPGVILPAKQEPHSRAAAVASTKQKTPPSKAPAAAASNGIRMDLVDQIWQKTLTNPELALVPVVLVGMVLFRLRKRRSLEDDFVLPDMSALIPSEAERYDMTHPVHKLDAEDFELLVALIYQRQGYRVSMPAGLSGGHGGDFTLARKSEKLLVQCKKFNADYKVPVERVRKLQEAGIAAGVTRTMYVASCGFSWDARNFARSKGVTIINAKILDTLITELSAKSKEDLFKISEWAPKLMSKVQLTPPLCPSCDASMDQVNSSNGSVWVCSQRPECRGRRSARKYSKSPAGARGNDSTGKAGSEEPPPQIGSQGARRVFTPTGDLETA